MSLFSDLQQIEKKRRDRINSSLAELRQLVPAVMRRQVGQTADISEIWNEFKLQERI